jgi:hypothetical protein
VVSITPRPYFVPGKDPVPILQEAGWAPGSVWTGAENLAPTRIRSPDRPSRSQSLYRLSYPAHDKVTLDDGFCYRSIPTLLHCTDPHLFIRYLPRCTGQSVSSSQVPGLRPPYGCKCIEGSTKFKISPSRRTVSLKG